MILNEYDFFFSILFFSDKPTSQAPVHPHNSHETGRRKNDVIDRSDIFSFFNRILFCDLGKNMTKVCKYMTQIPHLIKK